MLPRRHHTPWAVALLLALAACGGGSQSTSSAGGKPTPWDKGVPIDDRPVISGPIDPVLGGTIVSSDGRVTVTAPPGSVPSAIEVTVTEITNTAPGGFGNAYRITTVPPDAVLASPVAITFDADFPGTSIDAMTVSFQENDGWWLRYGTFTRDLVAKTITVHTTHFSDWSLVTRSVRDLRGTFTVDSTRGGRTVHLAGDMTLSFAGEDAVADYYLQWGNVTVGSAVGTCTVDTAQTPLTQTAPTNIAELMATQFRWGTSGNWALTCGASSDYLTFVFDTMGVSDLGCTRGYVGTPTLTPDLVAGTYTVNCGAAGATTATWSYRSCTPGGACSNPNGNACQTGVITCDTGYEVCTPTGNVADTTACGQDLWCQSGACVCHPGPSASCPAQDVCHDAAIDCTTGSPVCQQTAKANGTTCGADLVCSSGACVCQPGPSATCPDQDACHTGTIDCSTGSPVCTQIPKTDGASCGTDLLCQGGACTCQPGPSASCPPQDICHDAAIACVGNSPICQQTAKADGTTCGADRTCQGGACACQPGPSPTCLAQDACHTAAIDCSTGSPVCTQTPRADGTACAADSTCVAGACTCQPGAPGPGSTCAPQGVCYDAAVTCTNNTPSCTQTMKANGTACGPDTTCQNGACACQPGPSPTCLPQDACHTAAIDCSTGSPVCRQTPKANGTSCGTDQTCQAGACTCQPGPSATCVAQDACHTAAIDCASGSPVCQQTPKANGTSCGADQTCQAGACTCQPGPSATCVAQDGCHTAAIDCTSGSPVCQQTAKADGTSCGADQTCQAGACTCQPGPSASCVAQDACHTAAIDCTSGSPVCQQTVKADGTSCGADQTCQAGACTCQPGPSATCVAQDVCHDAAIDCTSGSPVCQQTAKADGTTCGTDQTCQGGTCACQPGPSPTCTPTSSCWTAEIACGSGSPVCEQTMKPNGTACNATDSCNAGSCVTSRTVTGARWVTWWPESGALAPVAAADVLSPGTTVEARVSDGQGGFVVYPGTFAADGSFTIPTVPVGPYWLVFVGGDGQVQVLDTSASTIDLGYDRLGRADLASAIAGTAVDFLVTGLAVGDVLEASSANADVQVSAAVAAVPDAVTVNWFTAANGAPLHLLAAADPLVLHQLASQTAASSAGPLPYRAASGWTSLSGIATDPGVVTTVTATLGVPTSTGSLAVDWRTTQFASLLVAMGPSVPSANTEAVAVDPIPYALRVGASAHPLTSPAPVTRRTPSLLTLDVPAATLDFTADAPLGYGRFLAAPWNEWREVAFTAHVIYTATGATTSLDALATVVQRQVMPAPEPIVPALGPVASPLVGGLDAFAPQAGVGVAPTISWSAPAIGAPSRYTLTLYRLTNQLGATVASPVVTFTTAATLVPVPPGFLQVGESYFAQIEAVQIAGDGGAAAPFRAAGAWARASALTAVFTP